MPNPANDKYTYKAGDPKWKEVLQGQDESKMPELFKKEGWGKYKPGKTSEWDVASRLWPQKLYMKTPSAVQAVNQKFPIKKRVWDETGMDKFKNSLAKGWDTFAKWAKQHLGPLKPLIDMVMNFVPMGKTIQNTIQNAMGKVDNALGGKGSRDMSLYDVLFLYRNCIVALLLKLAMDYQVPVDVVNFKKLFHTTPEFKQILGGAQGGDFIKLLVAAESAAQKEITNNNAAEVPENRKEALKQTMELVEDLKKKKGPEGQPMIIGESSLKNWLS